METHRIEGRHTCLATTYGWQSWYDTINKFSTVLIVGSWAKAGTAFSSRTMIILVQCYGFLTIIQSFGKRVQRCLQLCIYRSEVQYTRRSLGNIWQNWRHHIHLSGPRNCDDTSKRMANRGLQGCRDEEFLQIVWYLTILSLMGTKLQSVKWRNVVLEVMRAHLKILWTSSTKSPETTQGHQCR